MARKNALELQRDVKAAKMTRKKPITDAGPVGQQYTKTAESLDPLSDAGELELMKEAGLFQAIRVGGKKLLKEVKGKPRRSNLAPLQSAPLERKSALLSEHLLQKARPNVAKLKPKTAEAAIDMILESTKEAGLFTPVHAALMGGGIGKVTKGAAKDVIKGRGKGLLERIKGSSKPYVKKHLRTPEPTAAEKEKFQLAVAKIRQGHGFDIAPGWAAKLKSKTAEAAMDTILENNETQTTPGEMPHLNPQTDPNPPETNDVAAFVAEALKGTQQRSDLGKLLDNLGETFPREHVVTDPMADKPNTPNIKVSSDVMWDSFFKELQKIASLKSVQLADEAFQLLKKQFPDMSVGELAARASTMGKEGRPSIARRLWNVVGDEYAGMPRSVLKAKRPGATPVMTSTYPKGSAIAEMKRTTPGKLDVATQQVKEPDVWSQPAGRRSTAVERLQAMSRRGDDPEKLTGVPLIGKGWGRNPWAIRQST